MKERGRLVALGNEGDPVLFGSADPNPVPGDWAGIRNLDGALALEHCVVRDADLGIATRASDHIADVHFIQNERDSTAQ